MNDSLNFVYCLDKNYNKQAFLSIASLLRECAKDKFKIYIIHKSPWTFKKYKNRLLHLFPNHEVIVIKFKFNIRNYPKLKKSHVSEATYYRIFLGDHIPEVSGCITYIDSDAFVVSDPTQEIKALISFIQENEYLIGAKTTDYFEKHQSLDIFERLGISNKYFNAGVLIINLEKWKKDDVSKKLKNKVIEIKDSIVYWDQDVLNAFIDGDYVEIPEELNSIINIQEKENIDLERTKIVHYVGKLKPWDKKGLKINPNTFYQKLNKDYF